MAAGSELQIIPILHIKVLLKIDSGISPDAIINCHNIHSFGLFKFRAYFLYPGLNGMMDRKFIG